MPRPAVADFVDSFFTATLFQKDDSLATTTLASQLSPSAQIVINGNVLTAEQFTSLIISQFRHAQTAAIESIKDLNIAVDGSDARGETGTVGQYTVYNTTNKSDGVATRQSATTIVQVTRVAGKLQVSGLWEAQTPLTDA